MQEIGFIHGFTKTGLAVVRFNKKEQCDTCNMCRKTADENLVEVKIKNNLNAKQGDKVVVQMGAKAKLAASFTIYMIPLLFVIVSLAITIGRIDDIYTALIALGALVVGFVLVFVIDKKIREYKGYLPKMVDFVDEFSQNNIEDTNLDITKEEVKR
jgi:sigma-E factor negative regulatory protein RseC